MDEPRHLRVVEWMDQVDELNLDHYPELWIEPKPTLRYTVLMMGAIMGLQFVAGLLVGLALGWWLS